MPPPHVDLTKQQVETHVISVIHRHCHTLPLEIIYIHDGRLSSALWRIHQLNLPGSWCYEVCRTILVAEGVTTDDDGVCPAWDGTGDTVEDDGFAEDGAAEDVTDLVRQVYGIRI